ncbi:MAG: hypothetical protein JRF55_17070 [Deltaproteobacteria bacterium]|nr:hypothetical protein [Deltaproteobacteria bacterium]
MERENVSENPSEGPKKRGKRGCAKGLMWWPVVIEQQLLSQGVNLIHG